MATAQAPWPEAITIDTSAGEPPGAGTASAPVQRALGAIRPHRPEHVWQPAHPYMQPD